MIDGLRRLRTKVEFALELHPKARDNPRYLDYIMLISETAADISFEQFKKVNFESIQRCRRKIQEEGLFLPSKEVEEQREEAQEAYKEFSRE